MSLTHKSQITIIGAGFTGLAAAYEIAKKGISVTVLESESEIGGLASALDVAGNKLDKFYHHWFTNDVEVMQIINELNLNDHVEINPTNTGMYYSNNFFKLSTPLDLLKFTPLSFIDRIRLGLLALRARRVKNWKELESKTACEWLQELGGKNVYKIVWEPLLKGKFGPYAEEISAVWFWNKLKLRGSSRGKGGEERLAYFKGGFIALANELAKKIIDLGGRIETVARVSKIEPINDQWNIYTARGTVTSDKVIVTTALPLIADMISNWAEKKYINNLNKIDYLGNICLVLELNQSLSNTYWLNVNDPSFPFVGVIEHTNFERAESYGGSHIVYLSKYLLPSDPLYSMNSDELLKYALPYLQKMFPKLKAHWIKRHHLSKARWSQPIVTKHYSSIVPDEDLSKKGFHICSMAQIYPEDRGTNYAIKKGRNIGKRIANLTKN